MRKILKVKDWLDNKHSVEVLVKRAAYDKSFSEGIKAQNLTPSVDPETGELNITFKVDPGYFSQDYWIGTRG